MKAKPPKWLYIAEYRCGCSEDSTRKNELLNYCGKHGSERIRIYKVPHPKQQNESISQGETK